MILIIHSIDRPADNTTCVEVALAFDHCGNVGCDGGNDGDNGCAGGDDGYFFINGQALV